MSVSDTQAGGLKTTKADLDAVTSHEPYRRLGMPYASVEPFLDDLALLRSQKEKLVEALRDALVQIDDGPPDCSGTMANGTRVWKGSFLRRIEAMRSALREAGQ